MGLVITPTTHARYDSESCDTTEPTRCSRDPQKLEMSPYKEQFQDICEVARFKSIINKALRHPRILHYIRVAIIADRQLLRIPPNTLASHCHNVTFQVSFDPSVEDLERIQEKVLAPFSDSVMPSPQELKLPLPHELNISTLNDGFLYFRCGLSSGTGLGNINPSKAAKLWAISQEARKSTAVPLLRSEVSMNKPDQPWGGEVTTHPNPIVIANWCWSGSSIWLSNVIEITPDAIYDAQRGYISEDMRLLTPGEKDVVSGPLKIPMRNGRSGLLSIVNDFIKNDQSLGLTAPMSTHDKQVVLDMIRTAHSKLWERFQQTGPTAFNI